MTDKFKLLLCSLTIGSFGLTPSIMQADDSSISYQELVNSSLPTYFPQVLSYEKDACTRYGQNLTCERGEEDLYDPYCLVVTTSGGDFAAQCVFNVTTITNEGVEYLIDPRNNADISRTSYECRDDCNSPPPGPPGVNAGVIVKVIDTEVLPSVEIVYDDFDNDKYPDPMDNCPFDFNNDQNDGDGDGIGDVCDTCPSFPSSTQTDNDDDGRGDPCDSDDDNDGIDDELDNCPVSTNASQLDTDGDGFGDLCDNDIDADGVPNILDNCEIIPNPGQENSDGHLDLVGDACDSDYDNDGYINEEDNSPRFSSYSRSDIDGDGIGDPADNCQEPNSDQLDGDGNGLGDICEQEASSVAE